MSRLHELLRSPVSFMHVWVTSSCLNLLSINPIACLCYQGISGLFCGLFKTFFVENVTSFVVDGDTMGFPVFVVVHAWSLGGALKLLLCACACVFKCICRAAVCFGKGLMIHLWPSTMWHSKDWADMVLIISSHFSMHKVFLLGLGVCSFFIVFYFFLETHEDLYLCSLTVSGFS